MASKRVWRIAAAAALGAAIGGLGRRTHLLPGGGWRTFTPWMRFLLAAAFPDDHERYRHETWAWIPGIY